MSGSFKGYLVFFILVLYICRWLIGLGMDLWGFGILGLVVILGLIGEGVRVKRLKKGEKSNELIKNRYEGNYGLFFYFYY